jgi:hypothetical protein
MAVYHPTRITCQCGHSFSANLAGSVNAGHTPAIRDKIMRSDFHRVGKKAFALNYWYAGFIVVDTVTINLVDKMPDNYAAMSHFEFFAETYALYYDYDDAKRKAIPKAVAKWLGENIGKRDPENPRKPAARRKPG